MRAPLRAQPKSLDQVRKDVDAELPDAHALGVDHLTTRTIPRWLRMELIPGERLRPGAHKMMLRPEEEAQLPLVGVGGGTLCAVLCCAVLCCAVCCAVHAAGSKGACACPAACAVLRTLLALRALALECHLPGTDTTNG